MVYVITVTCMYSLQPPSEHLSRFGGKGDVIGGQRPIENKKKEQQNLFGGEKGRLFEFLSNQHSSSRVLPLLYNPRQVTILPFSAFSEKSHVIALAGFHIFQFFVQIYMFSFCVYEQALAKFHHPQDHR